MKKAISVCLVLVMTCLLFLTGNVEKAEAMNNESAALLTAGLVLFGKPVLHAVTKEIFQPEPAYVYPRRAHYPVKSEVIYVEPVVKKHKRHFRYRSEAYERGYRDEIERLEYQRGQKDAREDYRDESWKRYEDD